MANTAAKATQDYIPIKDVRNGIVVLKDGGLRGVLLVSSLNFSLKSDDEREAILLQFQDFLNSLDFSIQIFIQSRKLDIRPYIALLEAQEKKQTNDLMKIQIQEYIGFVKNFTESTNIMTKHFFIVVPFTPTTFGSKKGGGPLANITGAFSGGKKTDKPIDDDLFEEYRTQLQQRISVVEQGLVRCGIRVVELGNEEVIELFYKLFNPGEAEKPIQLTK